jgi:lipopolysaccharide transport system ATP-binding protein
MRDVAIHVQGLSKRYEVFENQRSRLLHAFWPSFRNGMQEIWALRDVDFEVAHGESVAIIGRNGGGKSTLLQILTGVLAPTSGEVEVDGRVSALLELGSGFNPEYTGRDNVILNGLLQGLERDEILERFGEIADFAEIGDAMDRPVKTYSSGMMMRLAFAVQVLTDPQILIIDEALSVGDFFFQQKCFRRIRTLCEQGVTLLFVSHDMGTVRDLCGRAVYLRRGEVAFAGDSKTAIRRYLAEAAQPRTAAVPELGAGIAGAVVAGELPEAAAWRRSPHAPPGPLLAVELCFADGQPATHARIGETLRARVYFRADPEHAGHISFVVKNRYDQVLSNVGSYSCGLPAMSSGDQTFAVFELEIDLMLEAGLYSFMVAFGRPLGKNDGELVDDTGWFGPFRVDWDYENEVAPFLGMFGLTVRGRLLRDEARTSRAA